VARVVERRQLVAMKSILMIGQAMQRQKGEPERGEAD